MRNRKGGRFNFGKNDSSRHYNPRRMREMGEGSSWRANSPREDDADLLLSIESREDTPTPLDEIFRS